MIGWARFWSRAYMLHLEDEIIWLRARLDMERRRAELAIDELISTRVDRAVSVAQPTRPTPAGMDPIEIIDRLQRDPEFVEAGNA